MIKGKTSSGYKYNFNEKKIKDIRFVELTADMADDDEKSPGAMRDVINLLFSKDEKEKLYKSVEKDGIVSVEDVWTQIAEILAAAAEKDEDVKNSLPSPR